MVPNGSANNCGPLIRFAAKTSRWRSVRRCLWIRMERGCMSELTAAPAFSGMENIGSGSGVHAALREYAIVSVLARKGHALALMEKSGALDAPRQSGANAVTALGIGTGRWLFLGAPLDQ